MNPDSPQKPTSQTAPPLAMPLTTDQDSSLEPHYNLFFSLEYGGGSRCWRHKPLTDAGRESHALLIAQNVPIGAISSFTFHLSNHLVRPASGRDARFLWELFYLHYQFNPDRYEGIWQFLCQHYKP